MPPETEKLPEQIDAEPNEFASLPELDEFSEDDFTDEELGTTEEAPESGEAPVDDSTEAEAETAEGEVPPDAASPETETPDAKEEPAQEVKAEALVPQEPTVAAKPEDLQAQYQEFITRSVDNLTASTYKLTDEQKELADTSPSELLPKMAAMVHMQVLTQATTLMANMLPQMLPMITEKQSLDQQAEEKFFTQFPQLREHRDDVFRVARAYKSANPNVTGERAMQEIGTMAMVSLRLPLTQPEPVEQVAPSRPVIPTSAQGGPAPRPGRQIDNVFSQLIDLEED